MKRSLLFLCLLISSLSFSWAQEIEGTVLKSWVGAKGAITIPAVVTEIASNCFYVPGEDSGDGWSTGEATSNTEITSVDLNNVKKVGKSAFKGCIGITSIKALNLVTVEAEAFDGCSSLEQLSLPKVETIAEKAFANLTALRSVEFGPALTSLESNPFQNSPALIQLSVASDNGTFQSKNNALIRQSDATLVAIAGGVSELTLGEECRSVGNNAFFGCANLAKLTLSHATTVGDAFLVNCGKIKELYLPRLTKIEQHYLSFNGTGSLSLIDIHESDKVEGLESVVTDSQLITIYVKTEAIKQQLQSKLTRCKIVVGAPQSLTQYLVRFSANEGGMLEAWTTGGVNVNSGDQLSEGAKVSIKATPLFGMYIKQWEVNGKVITEGISTENTNGQIYVMPELKGDLTVKVTFAQKQDGYDVFFHSRAPRFGKLTCKLPDGTEVKSGDRVPKDVLLTYTAIPNEGFRVTDWYHELPAGGADKFEVIAGQSGKTTYTRPAEDLYDIQVDFDRNPDHYIVEYASFNIDNGTLTAAANGQELPAFSAVKKGSRVVFTAHPKEGFVVDEWQRNGVTIPGYRQTTYTIEQLDADVTVNMVCSAASDPSDTTPKIDKGILYKWTPEGDAILPQEVIAIAPLAFEGASAMTSLTLNEAVKEVGERAFLYCIALERFIVPEGNPHFAVEDGVLYNKQKTRLIAYPSGRTEKSYTMLASAESIQPGAFSTSPRLATVEVPSAHKHLKSREGALYTADGTTLLFYPTGKSLNAEGVITIPEGTKTLGRLALTYYPIVKTLLLPASLTKIEPLAVMYNSALENIGWAEGVEPQVTMVADSAFYYDRALKEIPYMPHCTQFGRAAFAVASFLEKVHIAADCAIAADAFMGCEAIKEVYSYGVTPQVIDATTFASIVYKQEAKLFVPMGTKEAYAKAMGWNIFGQIIEADILAVPQVAPHGLVVIYPNPTHDILTLGGAGADVEVGLYSLEGALVMRSRTDVSGALRLDVTHLPQGDYILRVDTAAYKVSVR